MYLEESLGYIMSSSKYKVYRILSHVSLLVSAFSFGKTSLRATQEREENRLSMLQLYIMFFITNLFSHAGIKLGSPHLEPDDVSMC